MTPQPAPMLKRTYDETLGLLIEARNYLAYKHPAERADRDPLDRLRLTGEAFRLTTRLTEVMAWLMAQRAVANGEISREQANAAFAFDNVGVCLEAGANDDDLPTGLRSLMGRSHSLYARVARLEHMVRRHRA